ncbi:hypothetical protein P7C71_g3651, partial [Lecanoromycetidae sp. Uapishka_2]
MSDNSETIPSHGDRNLGPMLLAVNWVVFTPSVLIVCLRTITRVWITHNFGWDDGVMVLAQGVFSIVTDFICAGFPVVLLWNAKLNIRTKVALNMLMGLGVITGAICIVRTSYSWEVLSDDVTWVGVGNALTRILEVNFGIIGGCAPIMRPLYLHIRRLYFTSSHESIDSTNRTTASQVQWYTPPSATPWYRRIWHAPEPKDHADGIPEKPEMVKVNDHKAAPKQRWPTKLVAAKPDKPENVTWAKDGDLDTMDSMHLPVQGVRRGDSTSSVDNDDEEEIPDMFGTYRYHSGWV